MTELSLCVRSGRWRRANEPTGSRDGDALGKPIPGQYPSVGSLSIHMWVCLQKKPPRGRCLAGVVRFNRQWCESCTRPSRKRPA